MHTVETKLYTFDELDEEAQEKAIEEVRTMGWGTEDFREDADCVLDWAKEKAEKQGIDIRDVRWTDRGWASFDAAFEARVDLDVFMKANKLAGKYRALYNIACEKNPDVKIDWAGCDIHTGGGSSFSQEDAEIAFYGWYNDEERDKLANDQADAVAEILDDTLKQLRNDFEDDLDKALEYRESDEYYREYLTGSTYEFTEDGEFVS